MTTTAAALAPRFPTASAAYPGLGAPPFRVWLAVREAKPRPIRFPAEARRIMVGVDFSGASDVVMGLVIGIAATTGTVVDLVHVFDGFTEAFIRGDRLLLDRTDAVLAGVRRALLKRTAAAVAQGVPCVSTSLTGAPAIELTRHAKRTGTDLLVLGLGTETRGPFGRTWSIDAATQVLRMGLWHERALPSPDLFDPTP